MNIINEFFVSFILIKLYFKFKVCRKIKFPLLWKFYFSKWKFYFSADKILIDKKEYDFWIKSDRQEIKNTLLKLKNIEFIDHSKDLIFQNSGIKAIPAYGHTPGQNAIIIDDKIVFWGDLLHLYDIQIPKPKIAIKFDIDQNEAIQTREKLLKEFKERKLKVIGTHVPFIKPKFLD